MKPARHRALLDGFATTWEAVGGVDWAELRPLGPIHALRWDAAKHDDLGAKLAGEQWIAGDLEFLELSIRVESDEAEEWQERFTAWARDVKLGVSAVATTKTEAVLQHFAAHQQPRPDRHGGPNRPSGRVGPVRRGGCAGRRRRTWRPRR